MSFTDSWIDSHRQDIIASLQQLVRINSVTASPQPNAPFGRGCREALDYTLGLCRKLGFDAVDMEGYIGYAELGEGEEMLGVLTHLDVVPEGEGWQSGPYDANIIDGLLYGRGALDDKGPAIASIYALAAVKAAGLEFRRRVRLIFGCDEESGMGCLAHYEKHERLPDMAFSPDAMYPMVVSEKNIYHATACKSYPSALHISAGTAVNAVPGQCVAHLPLAAEVVLPHANEDYLSVTPDGSGCKVTALGAAAHASTPELGANAIQRMLSLLVKLPLPAPDLDVVKGLFGAFAMEYHGESLGLDQADESGRLTLNLGTLKWDDAGFALGLDIRAPMMLNEAAITSAISAGLEPFGTELGGISFSEGYSLSEDCELVRELLRVYRGRTGDMTPPHRIGGGTYARHLTNAVAFGAEREGRANRLHMTDESIPVDDLIDDVKMLADAIAALACR